MVQHQYMQIISCAAGIPATLLTHCSALTTEIAAQVEFVDVDTVCLSRYESSKHVHETNAVCEGASAIISSKVCSVTALRLHAPWLRQTVVGNRGEWSQMLSLRSQVQSESNALRACSDALVLLHRPTAIWSS